LNILVVDDEPAICQVMTSRLAKAGHIVEAAEDGESALEILLRGDIDICICDIRLPGIDGLEVLKRSKLAKVDASFLMMTAFASVSTAVDAMREGAFDYLIKPPRYDDLLHRLGRMAQVDRLRVENRRLREEVGRGAGDQFVSNVGAMLAIERVIEKVAPTRGTVLITGESGTGKSYAARRIHSLSPRAEQVCLTVNCGAVPEQLLESEFFGHLKGAFTGADRPKRGLFREADGGTLVLDEVCDLPLGLQVKLLHVLEEMEVRPVGSERGRRVDVRIIAAANRDIARMVREGTFRKDLYYRLNVMEIVMPPLRERRLDLPDLLTHFLEKESKRLGLRKSPCIDPMAEEILLQYHWPGNLRELQNVIARALVMADGDRLSVGDLPPMIATTTGPGSQVPALTQGELQGALRDRVRAFEIEQIRSALRAAKGDRKQAANLLGIGLSTLYRKLEDHGLGHES
jgi:two-component system response regulator AtoC